MNYIQFPLKGQKTKKATINPKNNDNKCFQYAIPSALSHKNIVKDPQEISNKSFIGKYNYREISFPLHKENWKKFETNKAIALNILYVPYNRKEMRHSHISKHNSKSKLE